MKLLKWLLAILVAAWAGQYLLAMVAPNLIMEGVYFGGAKSCRRTRPAPARRCARSA
jgi:hypothetical protein